jgi:predicted transcriptional regulator
MRPRLAYIRQNTDRGEHRQAAEAIAEAVRREECDDAAYAAVTIAASLPLMVKSADSFDSKE